MGRSYSHLKSATQILNEYKGEEPFASFLKKYFARHKKFGSKDRKEISHLCYCYFRLGKALSNIPMDERILTGLFLCSDMSTEMLEQLKGEWNKKVGLPLKEKLLIINYSLFIEEVFPWKEELSKGTDYEEFCESFFIQPDLFLRLRPGYETTVKTKLLDHGISFSEITSSCLSLPNASRIENIIELDKEAVVQDYASQQTGVFLKNFKLPERIPVARGSNHRLKLWDCCAASGGKSLMLYDMDPDIELTVSDIRGSTLVNLEKTICERRCQKL
jgi:16S rRNA (cytosine967-C5)-methyltransferase